MSESSGKRLVARLGDTVFYTKAPPGAPATTDVRVVMRVNWEMLSRQKLRLLGLLWDGEGNDSLWGLVELIDYIQDSADGQGHPVVWFTDEWEADLEGEA